MQSKLPIIPILIVLNIIVRPSFALNGEIESTLPPVSKTVPSVHKAEELQNVATNEPKKTGSSQSHCRYNPQLLKAHRQLEPWLDKINDKIESSENFAHIKQLVVSNFDNHDRLVCWLTLDSQGQNLKNLRLVQSANKTGPISVDADNVFRDPANKLISSIMPFEPPPNEVPAKDGISIIFERKYPNVLITVCPSK